MELCIKAATCGNDISRMIEYSTKLGVKNIWVCPDIRDHYDAKGLIDFERLKTYQEKIEKKGLKIQLLSESIGSEDLVSNETVELKAEKICQTIKCMGKADIKTLFLFLKMEAPVDNDRCEQMWIYLSSLIKKIVPCAEKYQVKIANHGHQTSKSLVRNYKTLSRVLLAADSSYNGVTFCAGCHQIAGDNIYECIHHFGKKIFFVHARNVVCDEDEDKLREVLFDCGEIDIAMVITELEIIGYKGLISPEHLPSIDYCHGIEISNAWGLGYLSCLLKMRRKNYESSSC